MLFLFDRLACPAMLAGGFKRSGLFGLIGVVVMAIVVAVIASTAGNEANPKGMLALIFGLIAVFVVILFVLQRSDLERTAGGDAKAVQRAAAEGGELAGNQHQRFSDHPASDREVAGAQPENDAHDRNGDDQ